MKEILKNERDKLIKQLWLILRKLSDIEVPDNMTDEDLNLWNSLTFHSVIQNCLKRNIKQNVKQSEK